MPHVGQVLDDGNVRLEVTVTAAESGGDLHEMRGTWSPGSPFPPPHLHPAQDERFEVIEGELTFLVAGEERTVTAGSSIDVPAGTVHQARNAGEVPAVAVWRTSPALRTGEFQEQVHACRAAQDWTGLSEVVRLHADVFQLVPDPFAAPSEVADPRPG